MWVWGLWLGTWWIRGELGLALGDEEVMGSILVGGGLIPWCVGRGHEVGIEEEGGLKVIYLF
jgi:hypothetical protein